MDYIIYFCDDSVEKISPVVYSSSGIEYRGQTRVSSNWT